MILHDIIVFIGGAVVGIVATAIVILAGVSRAYRDL